MIPAEPSVVLRGNLDVPDDAAAIVVFAHGSGSSHLSPRNRHVAAMLQSSGLATLLMDLLTPEEEREDSLTRHLRFDIELLAERLEQAVRWLRSRDDTRYQPIGYFGASTGAAAALVAAARDPDRIGAVVARGGRPELADSELPQVRAPTLLIVGGSDRAVLEVNRTALRWLTCEKKLEVVPGATHLFEEPGTLDCVAQLASRWFIDHLLPGRRRMEDVPLWP